MPNLIQKVSVLLIGGLFFAPAILFAQETASVTRVVDGDTLKVQIDGAEETVRLIGVDTPETVHPSKPVQCFGREASAEVTRLAEGRQLRLERKSEENADRYGRLLRYVYVQNGGDEIFLNQYLIREGFGYAYLEYPFDNALMQEFRQAETLARENSRGLWAQDTCGGDREAVRNQQDEYSFWQLVFDILRVIFQSL